MMPEELFAKISQLSESFRVLQVRLGHLARLIRRMPKPEPKRRGRKFMGPEERRQVARRMKLYWAQRRIEKAGGSAITCRCEICHMGFANHSGLSNHMRKIHPQVAGSIEGSREMPIRDPKADPSAEG